MAADRAKARAKRNILFIMFDQLRFDYLSCAGHPTLRTPNIDRLAARGVRFTNAYVQSPICGSSRMSFYTGRYVHSHGASWNGVPLKVGEMTLGDHLRQRGMDAVLVGKTHMRVDRAGMERLGLEPDSIIGARVSECGFDVWLRDDGIWPEGPDGAYDDDARSPYNAYLNSLGYEGANPWHDHANAGTTDKGEMASGWFLGHSRHEANIAEEHSETPWLTRETIAFMESRRDDDRPWLCHASYIKPHWPYIAPAPYHAMYDETHVPPANRSEAERADAHPVHAAFMQNVVGRAYHRQDVRETVIPAYMGLIKQCDDQMGVLFDYLERSGRMADTMIVLTSDHGDYLGDHWCGEKGFVHDCSAKVPMIVYDPSPEADATRGTVCDALVESIDLAATFTDWTAGDMPDHIIEGRSLLPWLHGRTPDDWREFTLTEYDYSQTPMRDVLGVDVKDARLFALFDGRFKFIHFEGEREGEPIRPMLFDLAADPDELNDLARDPAAHGPLVARMMERLGGWARRVSQRTTLSDADIRAMTGKSRRRGVVLGAVDESDVPEDLTIKYRGPSPKRP